jgi:hypothetical protein
MEQSKEYSEKDFLYSGYTDVINDAYCNKTDVEWKDLINESCNTFKSGTNVSLKINGKDYTVPITEKINTIEKIANEFTSKNTPYKFSYDSSNDNLIIVSAKESNILNERIVTISGSNNDKTLSFTVDQKTYKYTIKKPIESSTKATSTNDIVQDAKTGKFRKFDPTKDTTTKNKVSTTQVYTPPTYRSVYVQPTTKRVWVKAGGGAGFFGGGSWKTVPNKAGYWNHNVLATPPGYKPVTTTSIETINIAPKIIDPSVTDKILGKLIPGVYTDGAFVFDLTDQGPTTFKIKFDSIKDEPLLTCDGTKYLKIKNLYYKFPYTIKVTEPKNIDSMECRDVNRNIPLCENMKIAKNIIDKTQKHPGFAQQYVDAKGFSDMSVLNLMNLGIGIVATSVFIANTYK